LELTTENDTKAGHILGGHSANSIEADFAAVISGGGGDDTESNRIWEEGNYGTIGGGASNKLGGIGATIAGGGGFDMADEAFVGNTANGDWTAIGGGRDNTVEGTAATVPGGEQNEANGDYSFAVGRAATAQGDGTFVVGDSTEDPVEVTDANLARFQMNVVADAFELAADGAPTIEADEGIIDISGGEKARFQMDVVADAFELVDKRGEPTLEANEGMIYISDAEGANGDLVYAYSEDGDTTETVVIAENPSGGT